MTPEDPAPDTADGEPAGAADIEPAKHKRKGRKDIPPVVGAKNYKSARDEECSQGEETGQAQAKRLERPDAELAEGKSGLGIDDDANGKDSPALVGVKSNTLPVDQPKQRKGGRKTKAQRHAEILAAITHPSEI